MVRQLGDQFDIPESVAGLPLLADQQSVEREFRQVVRVEPAGRPAVVEHHPFVLQFTKVQHLARRHQSAELRRRRSSIAVRRPGRDDVFDEHNLGDSPGHDDGEQRRPRCD